MIITHVRHGRSARDAANLAAHLLKDVGNESVEVAMITGLAAADLPGAIGAMRRLATRRGSAAFHHVSLSPSADCGRDELLADTARVNRAGIAGGSNP